MPLFLSPRGKDGRQDMPSPRLHSVAMDILAVPLDQRPKEWRLASPARSRYESVELPPAMALLLHSGVGAGSGSSANMADADGNTISTHTAQNLSSSSSRRASSADVARYYTGL